MLKKLALESFRGFEQRSFSFGAKNVLIGPNGSGKTSVLEAIRLLSVGKSFRTSNLAEAITFEKPFFRLTAELSAEKKTELGLFYGLQFPGEPLEKQQTVNRKAVTLLESLGLLPTVLFVPNDLEVVLGSPQARRQYLDGILFQTNKEFRLKHLELSGVLRERSALLFMVKINRASSDELRPWDELLTNLTEFIRAARQNYLNDANAWIGQAHQDNRIKTEIKLSYVVGEESLEKVREREIATAQNLYGPHRDDCQIDFLGRSTRRYSSRGQARVVLSALKAAEVAIIAKRLTEPLILLDDLFSELDEDNALSMLELFADSGQVIITTATPRPLLKTYATIDLDKP